MIKSGYPELVRGLLLENVTPQVTLTTERLDSQKRYGALKGSEEVLAKKLRKTTDLIRIRINRPQGPARLLRGPWPVLLPLPFFFRAILLLCVGNPVRCLCVCEDRINLDCGPTGRFYSIYLEPNYILCFAGSWRNVWSIAQCEKSFFFLKKFDCWRRHFLLFFYFSILNHFSILLFFESLHQLEVYYYLMELF